MMIKEHVLKKYKVQNSECDIHCSATNYNITRYETLYDLGVLGLIEKGDFKEAENIMRIREIYYDQL